MPAARQKLRLVFKSSSLFLCLSSADKKINTSPHYLPCSNLPAPSVATDTSNDTAHPTPKTNRSRNGQNGSKVDSPEQGIPKDGPSTSKALSCGTPRRSAIERINQHHLLHTGENYLSLASKQRVGFASKTTEKGL